MEKKLKLREWVYGMANGEMRILEMEFPCN